MKSEEEEEEEDDDDEEEEKEEGKPNLSPTRGRPIRSLAGLKKWFLYSLRLRVLSRPLQCAWHAAPGTGTEQSSTDMAHISELTVATA